jgi:hypothetical protein
MNKNDIKREDGGGRWRLVENESESRDGDREWYKSDRERRDGCWRMV